LHDREAFRFRKAIIIEPEKIFGVHFQGTLHANANTASPIEFSVARYQFDIREGRAYRLGRPIFGPVVDHDNSGIRGQPIREQAV
jgi:hypothetical protein